MYNFRSPIVQQQYGYMMNPYQQQQQPYYYTAPGYNNPYYTNQYQHYNPYLAQQQAEAERKRQYEQYKEQLNMYKRLQELSLKYLNIDYDQEVLDIMYDPNPQARLQQEQPQLKKKVSFTVVCSYGDEEVYNSSEKEDYVIGDSYDDTPYYQGYYYDTVKPSVERVRQLEMMQAYSMNYVNPQYVNALKKIEEDRNKLVDPNCDLNDFLDNAYKLYIEALEMDTVREQNQLNTLFNGDKYRQSLYSGSVDFDRVFNSTNLDDHVIGLPDRLKNEYSARKRAFIEKCMQRSNGGVVNG